MRLLYVSTTQGPREVAVLMEADGLAVTESLRGGGWSITHTKTGMALVADEVQESTARKVCLALGALVFESWTAMSFDDVVRWRQVRGNAEKVRKIITAARAEDAS